MYTVLCFFLNKQSHKKKGNQFKKLQLVKDSCIVIHIFKVCIIKSTHPSSGTVVMEIHQCACVTHSPFSCINKHPGEMAGPPHIVAASSPLKPARLVPPFSHLGRVTPTLQQVTLAASSCDGVNNSRRGDGIHKGRLSAPY